MIEHLFYHVFPGPTPIHPKIPSKSMKQLGRIRRLIRMNATIRPIAFTVLRSSLLVALAMLLVMVLLPAALNVQAATS
jgi:hypothetical protein